MKVNISPLVFGGFMKKIVVVFLFALGFAFAQSPAFIADRTFDRLGALEADCFEYEFFADLAVSFDQAYCAYIPDQITSVNQRWTSEVYEDNGYEQHIEWNDDGALGIYGESWYAGYGSNQYASVVALFLVYSIDGTAMIMTFDPAE